MFNILRKYQMKLNPSKCVFGVGSGKFLGFMVNQRGIEVNPMKIKALFEMSSPKKPKKVISDRSLRTIFRRAKGVQEV